MRRASSPEPAGSLWPDPWRMALIALCALILCSCRGPSHVVRPAGASPPFAFDGPPGIEQGAPLPYEPAGPWSPPGLAQPWPEDEYLRDGGDAGRPAGMGLEWEVLGLDVEDTVAHYDTLAGRRVVEPSNRVHIYSPRFNAVRQVVSLVAAEQHHRLAGTHAPTKLVEHDDLQTAGTSTQNLQAEGRIAASPPISLRSKQGDGAMSSATGPRGFQDAFLPYENLRIIRSGVFDGAEMAFLAQGVQAAIVWSHKAAVQVILEHEAAMADVADQKLQSIYTVKQPPANPRLRVVKVASTPFAEPGDEIDFTIRFDNVGNQPIGNVTIIDNLTTRLEYVDQSAQCSLPAQILTQPNEGDSLVIRCEVTDALRPGEGGILRFRCRVR